MKRGTKALSYVFAVGLMAMISPMSVLAAENSGTGGAVLYDYLAAKADKVTEIDFNEAPATGNVIDQSFHVPVSDIGGLYLLQSSKNREKPIYFFRGNVTDNNVIMNNFCWLIVRTTETGGTKLLYNGVPTNGQCLGDPDWSVANDDGTAFPKTVIGRSIFNENDYSPASIGYMHGADYNAPVQSLSTPNSYAFGNDVTYSSGRYTLKNTASMRAGNDADMKIIHNGKHYTCLSDSNVCSTVYYVTSQTIASEVFAFPLTDGETLDTALVKMYENSEDSDIKTFIDNWYEDNMANAGNLLEDTVWYNDKEYVSGSLSGKDVNFNTPFDEEGISMPQATIDTWYHGATRDNGSALPLVRRPNVASDEDDSQVDYLEEEEINIVPSFDYTTESGKFTVSTENGNGKLTYPVGMLTTSEIVLAGASPLAQVLGTYIDNGYSWWSLSSAGFAFMGPFCDQYDGYFGSLNNYSTGNELGVRPSVSLKTTLAAAEGDGSPEHPFASFYEVLPTDEDKSENTLTLVAPTNPQTSDSAPVVITVLVSAIAVTSIARKSIRVRR